MMKQLFDVEGKVIIITGASQGIGKEIAEFLARLGAKVVLVARNEEKLQEIQHSINSEGYEALAVPLDILNLDQTRIKMAEIYHHFGKIDVLINNAGINIAKPIEEISEDDWDKVLDLNLKGLFFCCQTVGKYLQENPHGKIINMSSQMAKVGYFNRTAYCSSKGGVTQLTKSLAIEWANHSVNVNAIAPTFIETPMTNEMFKDNHFKEEVLSRIPLGRMAKSEDLFGAVLYLGSSASNMVTGQTLYVDGGWTVW